MRFGPFEIVRSLGRGGMAETFHARRSRDGVEQDVCLKRVLPELVAEEDFVYRFQREARLAARLDHPHVVPLYDFGCHDGTWWMALELVRGGDLRGLLDALGQPMPFELGLVLLSDMLEALHYAHARGVIHRDVSPSNVLVDLEGNFQLADFGIAKIQPGSAVGTVTRSTTTGVIRGKAAYMAPEQALARELDGRADLFALGVVMFEAFAGKKPFEGPNDIAVMMAATQGRRAPMGEVAPQVPIEVRAIIERMLEPDRDHRYASAAEVLAELSRFPRAPAARERIAAMLDLIAPDPTASRAEPTTIDEGEPAWAIEPGRGDAPALEEPPASASVAPAGDVAREARISPGMRRALSVLAAALAFAATVFTVALVRWVRTPAPEVPAAAPARVTTLTVTGAGPALAQVAPPPIAPELAPEGTSRPPVEAAEPSSETISPPPPAEDLEAVAQAPIASIGASSSSPEREAPARRPSPSALPTPPSPRPASARASEPTERPRGSLHVTVFPWGDVVVDGSPEGRSPVNIHVPAGRHQITVRSGERSASRAVVVAPDRRTSVEFDLSGS